MTKSEIAAARRKQVLDLVTEKGRQMGELALLMGISSKIVTNYVVRMVDLAQIHFVIEAQSASNGGTKGVRVYYPGAGPELDQAQDPQPPFRPVTRSWRLNNRRDPLVAALFGPASNDPRCACCRQLQGEPHVSGCRYEWLAA